MHKYKYFPIIFALVATLGGCKKSFLNLNPHDQLSEDVFWKTEQDGRLALTGCYNTLLKSYFRMDRFPAWDGISDNAWGYGNEVHARDAMTTPMTSTTAGMVTDFYTNTYQQIAVCNYFLDNVNKLKIPQGEMQEWTAEVLFLRSFYYFYLSEFYGDVPLILSSYTLNGQLIKKSSHEVVVKQILGDLDTAIKALPVASYTDGHVVQGTAQLLKSKIYLYNHDYVNASAAAEAVMQSAQFSLYSNYQNLFLKVGQGADNKEIMFSVRYLSPSAENISALRWGWWMALLPLQNMVDAYDCVDGNPIGISGLYDPANPYANRDPRLNASIMVPGSSYGFTDEGAPDWNDRIQWLPKPLTYCMRKYVEPSIHSVAAANHCENDVVIFRYADVLLSYAESENEVNGPTQNVYDAVNLVCSRVNMPSLPAGLSQGDMRDRIRSERRVEFAFEGQRWLDINRWGIASDKINSIGTDQAPVKYIYQSNNNLWPFPQSEVDYYKAHGQDLGQNPGY